MQVELKALQRALGITFVFVTHDQGEALSMADRVAVFNDGRIVQVGTPAEVYERPRTRFVADFVGSVQRAQRRGVRRSARCARAVRRACGRRRSRLCRPECLGTGRTVVLDGRRRRRLIPGRGAPRHGPTPAAGLVLVAAVPAASRADRARRAGRGSPCGLTPSSRWRAMNRPALASRARRGHRCAASRTCWSAGMTAGPLLLAPPLLWLGMVYVGSLIALPRPELLLASTSSPAPSCAS